MSNRETKLRALWLLLRTRNYLIITDRGYLASTPVFGHKRFWIEAQDVFNIMKEDVEVIRKKEA